MKSNTKYCDTRYELNAEIKKIIIPIVNTVLDIGCGIRPQEFTTANKYFYVEPYEEYLSPLSLETKNKSGEHIVYNTTWAGALNIIDDHSVDSIFILDVIEHLDKEIGIDLLAKTIPKAIKQIIIFTPLGFIEQESITGKDAWGYNGGEWQKHKSGWLPTDFTRDWECLICKNFHIHDNLGRLYNAPKGAFFAIKTIEK